MNLTYWCCRCCDSCSPFSNVATVTTSTTSIVYNEIPNEFNLYQNYPNPFNPESVIRFDLPKNTHVKITVYNILGTRVKVLTNKIMTAGTHQITFNATGLSSGVYVYSIITKEFRDTKKAIILK